MPEIEITAEQRERLRDLQDDLRREVVGKYGHVRTRDAIEYLLDRYAGDEFDGERPDGGAADESGDTDAVEADASLEAPSQTTRTDAEDTTATESDAEQTPPRVDGTQETAAPETESETAGGEADGEAEEQGGGEAVARVVEAEDGPSAGTGADGGSTATTEEDTTPGGGATTTTGETTQTTSERAGGDSMLNAMLDLLETHSDKWSESSAADQRYEVTLPDGRTEHVRTKDDVKALLFKHYR